MIEKRSYYPAFDPVLGQLVHVIWTPDRGLEKTASIVKEAALKKECLEFIEGLEPQDGKIYTAVNAITAGEFYGSNRNGDYFNEAGLAHEGKDYGYRTFLQGHNFCHHENQDPKNAVGIPKAAFYNEKMHRVELVVETDMERLRLKDPEFFEKLACGEPVDVSMGSKCDFDVCSICKNKAATKLSYCEHLREDMNAVMDDGRKVYAYTPHPRFFDISFVKRGADRTAKVMHTIVKSASDEKDSSIVKYSPPKAKAAKVLAEGLGTHCPSPEQKHAVALLERYEPDLPDAVIDKMAAAPLPIVIGTLTKLGVVLKPREYQRMILVGAGEPELADRAEAAGDVFDFPEDWESNEKAAVDYGLIQPEAFDFEIARELAPFMPRRSIWEPHLTQRLKTASLVPSSRLRKESSLGKKAFLDPEILAALGLGYLIYRKSAPEAEIKALEGVLKDPRAAKAFLWKTMPIVGGVVALKRMMEYEPRVQNVKYATAVVAPVAGAYLYSAYARRKAEQGRPVSGIEHMFVDYPLPMALAGVYGASKLKAKFSMAKGTKKASSDITKSSIDAVDVAAGMMSGMYRMRPWALPAAAVDTYIFGKMTKALEPKAAPQKREKVSGVRVESGRDEKELVKGGSHAYYARAF